MKHFLSVIALSLLSINAYAGSESSSNSASDAGAIASTGNITFEASEQRKHTSVATTAPVYVAPSMFGGQNNCGQSSTGGVSITGFGIGGSVASESGSCNTRQDTSTAWNLGLPDVARLRFFCFGEDINRMAYEASGRVCPEGSTAKGIDVKYKGVGQMASAQTLNELYGN